MVKFYILQDNHIVIKTLQAVEANIDKSSIVWVDLFSPSADELKLIAQHYCVEFPTSNEREEIEMSSRYWEDHNSITINAYFFIAFLNNGTRSSASHVKSLSFLPKCPYAAVFL